MNNGLKRRKEKDERLKVLLDCDYDELVAALKSHIEIGEADEWRPLADHVLSLIELALKRTAKSTSAAETCCDVLRQFCESRGRSGIELAEAQAAIRKAMCYGALYGAGTGKPPWPRCS